MIIQLNAIRLNSNDNVAVAIHGIAVGDRALDVILCADIPRGHKFATRDIAQGEPVLKYGQVMGIASRDIAQGDHVHSHNVGMIDSVVSPYAIKTTDLLTPTRTTFAGFTRPNGKAGTRNYIGILASVNCSATVCGAIADAANRLLKPKYPNIDGFTAIVHDQGCGMANAGEGFETLVRTLKGYRDHPNFGGVLIIGLGCEVNQLTLYQRTDWTKKRFGTFNIQDVVGSRSAVERAVQLLEPIAAAASSDVRTPQPVSKLVLGMQCGGSDGFSGITANPALGLASDLLVAAGAHRCCQKRPKFTVRNICLRRALINRPARRF